MYNCRYESLPVAINHPSKPIVLFPSEKDNKCPESSGKSKQNDHLSDEDYFMAMACLASQRSKDPVRQVITMHVNDLV